MNTDEAYNAILEGMRNMAANIALFPDWIDTYGVRKYMKILQDTQAGNLFDEYIDAMHSSGFTMLPRFSDIPHATLHALLTETTERAPAMMESEVVLFRAESTRECTCKCFELFIAAMFATDITFYFISPAILPSRRETLSMYIDAIRIGWMTDSLTSTKLQ